MTVLQFLSVVKFGQKITITTETKILYNGYACSAGTSFDKLTIRSIYSTHFGKIIVVVD